MTFVCLGYLDAASWGALSEGERAALLEEGLAYDAELRRGGYLVGGQGLRGVRQAVTLRGRDGRVAVTDGPHAAAPEHLGGILSLEARDLNHVIQLMSWHPAIRGGSMEIRAADEPSHGAGRPGARTVAARGGPGRGAGPLRSSPNS